MRSPAFPMRALRLGGRYAVGWSRAAQQAPKYGEWRSILALELSLRYGDYVRGYLATMPRESQGVKARSCTCPASRAQELYWWRTSLAVSRRDHEVRIPPVLKSAPSVLRASISVRCAGDPRRRRHLRTGLAHSQPSSWTSPFCMQLSMLNDSGN